MKHKPAFIINVKVPAGSFDVNLAPDKREVVFANEEIILEKLKDHIDGLYAPSRYTFRVESSTENLLFQSNMLGHVSREPSDSTIDQDSNTAATFQDNGGRKNEIPRKNEG